MALSRQPLHFGVSRRAVSNLRPSETLRLFVVFALAALSPQLRAEDVAVSLPVGVKAVWEVTKAYHETTPTRERICLNGLWRWQPADAQSEKAPGEFWGFVKVPGC